MRTKYKCSLTVEAALAFPIFFYATMTLCCLIIYLNVQYNVQRSMLYAARALSCYGDIVKLAAEKRDGLTDFIGTEIIENEMENILVRTMDSGIIEALVLREMPTEAGTIRCVQNGIYGFDFADSILLDDNDCIKINCRYLLRLPVGIPGIENIPVEQSLTYRYFTGHQVEPLYEWVEADEDASEEYVYITETGSVFHWSRTCSSLIVSTKGVLSDAVSAMRNDGGGKYYPCELCVSGNKPDTVYITGDGNRYHYNMKCSALKRTVKTIPLSEAKNRRACKRCSGSE